MSWERKLKVIMWVLIISVFIAFLVLAATDDDYKKGYTKAVPIAIVRGMLSGVGILAVFYAFFTITYIVNLFRKKACVKHSNNEENGGSGSALNWDNET